jgi:hypothetical protein
MAKIKGKQINQLVGQANWNTIGIAVPSASTLVVTTAFTGKTPGGSDTVAGVLTTPIYNKVFLRESANGKPLTDPVDGVSVFARLTEASGTWTLSFFVLVNGIETPFDFTGHPKVGQKFDFRWCEVVQLADSSPTTIVYAGEGIDEFDPSSPTNHIHIQETFTITTNGQTVFSLTQTPKDTANVIFFVNGIAYNITIDYTVVGTTLTWLNVDFTLQTSDRVTAEYAY